MNTEVKISGSRNALGQWRAKFERAKEDALREMGEDGVRLAIDKAPASKKHDPRTPHLKDSIFYELEGDVVRWGSDARHAGYIEKGGNPSELRGDVSFYWERRKRWWGPGDNTIHHPGISAKPYLSPSWDEVTSKYRDYIRKHLAT